MRNGVVKGHIAQPLDSSKPLNTEACTKTYYTKKGELKAHNYQHGSSKHDAIHAHEANFSPARLTRSEAAYMDSLDKSVTSAFTK